MFKIQVPGKLLLAGEYAILEPGSLAMVLGVNRYLYAEITPTVGFTLSSPQNKTSCSFKSLENIEAQHVEPFFKFSATALALTASYLAGKNKVLPSGFTLTLNSQLQQGSIKLGLGSSAAACVATVAALMRVSEPDTPLETLKTQIFKLAYLAHYQVQGSGSGADIAGCVYGSTVAYTRPDLNQLPLRGSVADLVDRPWPFLDLQAIHWPKTWALYFGWTGNSASSKALIEDFEGWKKEDPEAVDGFFFQMQMGVLALKQALLDGDQPAFVQQLAAQRRLLALLNDTMVAPPETPLLKSLADQAEQLGGAGKFSGAGGGDCGLAWVPESAKRDLFKQWQTAGIQPLDLQLDTEGVRCETF